MRKTHTRKDGRKKRTNCFRVVWLPALLAVVLAIASCERPLTDDRPLTDTSYSSDEPHDSHSQTEKKPQLILKQESVDHEERMVIVTVSVKNNPGLSALQLRLQYGEDLELKSVQFDPRYGSYVTAPTPYTNPQTVTFLSPFDEVTEDGLFAVLNFRIKGQANPQTTARVQATIVPENTLTANLEEIDFEIVNNTVTID